MATALIDRNGNLLTDNMLDIPRDAYQQVSSVNKFGHNVSVAAGVEEEIWTGSVAYPFPATALMTKINTTADVAGMRGETVELQGLNASWELVVQTKALDASNSTTLVTLDTPLIRCFRMKFQSATSGTSPITLVNDADNVIYAIIESGDNQTEMAIYTVPAGKTAYVTNWYATINAATGLDPTANSMRLRARNNAAGYAPKVKHHLGLTVGDFQHFFSPYYKFTEKTDIYVTAQPTGKAADVVAGFDLILVDNDRNW